MKNFFRSRKVTKQEFQQLQEGEQIVRLISYEELTSFEKYNHDPKDTLPEWTEPTQQLGIVMVSAAEGVHGGITERLNNNGWLKYADLTDAQQKSGKFENIEGYACTRKGDDVLRIEDPGKTEYCLQRIDQFAAALGLEEGSDFMEGLDQAIADKKKFVVSIVAKTYNDKDHLEVSRFKPYHESAEVIEADASGVADDFE